MRAVLDTVVFVRALIKPSNACGRTIFLNGKIFQLAVSKEIVLEILEVLGRPEISSKFSSTFTLDYKRILDLLSGAYAVEIGDIGSVSRDATDDKFLATAIAAGADYLVSQDEDLLVLKKYKGIKIVTCLEFANILEAKNS